MLVTRAGNTEPIPTKIGPPILPAITEREMIVPLKSPLNKIILGVYMIFFPALDG